VIPLDARQLASSRSYFLPDRPGPLVGLHAIHTGVGVSFADRWPEPRALLVGCYANWSLVGDPEALQPNDLRDRLAGFVDAAPAFLPLLRKARPDLSVWKRVIYALPGEPEYALPRSAIVRRLEPDDGEALQHLSPNSQWIWETSGGPSRLAGGGLAWGAFVDGRIASVAAAFMIGDRYEDIGVVTEAEHRGEGLSPACAGRLCEDIRSRGRTPSWSTSHENTASRRVAEKLRFELDREDLLYVVGQSIPEPARRSD
jgi:RimJ/RimL family protein N-acetyltransferase